ncbi:MAG: hypothetical protein A3G32_03735 [Deltaproteobacteria bacterium RIFCSPLOWO2_12_FULL_40_28]|nr:MAG: hypothetical protein A3C45_05620 [Deltaproteobacteria bacterium RIFCSPHIGHO2_02_FULL_40_28]OGQ19434.1 MAG: hypothetical protein A3E27_06250 [Deltaproteobacteria bacterium RIFCSPHIGHO2_12_FULL_40_32]OGQ39878.1 MAG: hypothetical protein A3I69_07215 [Deltaproteobacteria bacterium RIFCSPLOWO2_02_FULL_40_36]OGQ53872.1 MAG: hypothetical protein A3G32_03735 [Deltaproteobacteria bacterium RIFCSPLOWO2_12_FULL_40_28]
MKIFLKYFSIYRDRFQKEEATRDYPSASSIKEIFLSHFQEGEDVEKFLKYTRFAVNAEFVPIETILNEGDELVFIPPVSGG